MRDPQPTTRSATRFTPTIFDPIRLSLSLGSIFVGIAALWSDPAIGAEFPTFEPLEIDPNVGRVCYAVQTADVDGDGDLDVCALSEDAVLWYENPTWTRHEFARGATRRDNVCFAPRDLDGDGRVDFALGAYWAPSDTRGSGTLQWLTRSGGDGVGADASWQVVPIAKEPTIHRMGFGDVKGSGNPQLIVVPLQGRGTSGPQWDQGQGVRILVFDVPDDPFTEAWPMEVADDTLHTTHNFQALDLDDDGRDELLIGAWEGLFLLDRDDEGRWQRTKLGIGSPEATPFAGVSEVKLGRLEDGTRYIATIEPWHGQDVVVYLEPASNPLETLWTRTVIDTPVRSGHAVWCVDLDGDPDDELVIGHRNPNPDGGPGPQGPGIRAYDPVRGPDGSLGFTPHIIDDGGVAVEDLRVDDLDGDGRPELIAGGRATHNLKIYWNR